MHDLTTMPERLAAFLATVAPGRTPSIIGYELMTGGYSRVMARAVVDWGDGTVETIVLRGDPPPDRTFLVSDRDAEWSLLRSLTETGAVPMPAARYFDDGTHLGTKVIVLDHCSGPSLQSVLATLGDDLGRHPLDFAETVARTHLVDESVLPSSVIRRSNWDSYMDQLIGEWTAAERQLTEANPIMRYVPAWLDAHRPPELPLRLVHGDLQPANIMVGDGGVHLLIDWEYAHLGDPREDLGWYLNYAMASPPNMYAPDPEAFLARYREITGFPEAAVNQLTVAYFSMVSAARVFSQILLAADALADGRTHGVMTTYNINAATTAHVNFMAACNQLTAAMATTPGAGEGAPA